MGGIVNCGLIQQDQVLIGTPSPDTESRGTLTGYRHPGKQLDGLNHIHFSHKGRNFPDGLNGKLGGTCFDPGNIGISCFS